MTPHHLPTHTHPHIVSTATTAIEEEDLVWRRSLGAPWTTETSYLTVVLISRRPSFAI